MQYNLKTMWAAYPQLTPQNVGNEWINFLQTWNNYDNGVYSWSNLNATKATIGSLTLTTPLPIASGGTNIGTTLNNNRVMISSAGSIVENSALTASGLMATDSNGIPTGTLNGTGVYALGQTNIAINGGMDFWQRGTTFSNLPTGTYTADRWKFIKSSNRQIDCTQEATLFDSSLYALKIVSGGGNTVADYLQQLVENYTFYAGLTVTVSIRVKTSTASIARAFCDDSVTTTTGSFHSGSGNYETLTVTKTVSASPGSLSFGVQFSGAATIYADSCMVVLGSQPVSFVPRPFAQELALCQRYYEKSYALATVPGTAIATSLVTRAIGAQQAVNTEVYQNINFNVSKLAAPTVTVYTAGGTSGQVTSISTAGASTAVAVTVDVPTVTGFSFFQTTNNNPQATFAWTAASEL